jgi:primosomal protein N' (replication factor Y) (superfamily II helicase)
VSLLIPSHALPPLSYRVPDHLKNDVRIGSAVVAPLSGFGRLGVVVAFERDDGRDLKEIRATTEDLNLPPSTVKLCAWAADASAQPLQAALRAALPPETNASRYRIIHPVPDWPWTTGATVGRTELRRFLGSEGLKDAEEEGRVALAPARPARREVEWAVLIEGRDPNVPRRARRQRELLEALRRGGGSLPVAQLLHATGAGRDALKRLTERGAVRLQRRPEPAPVSYTRGSGSNLVPYRDGASQALARGGAHLWRVPTPECPAVVAAVAREAAGLGKGTLVLAPEVETVERLVRKFRRLLPAGLTVAAYHGELGRARAAVYEAARRGEVDVLVGTRAAALVPVSRLGAVCVADEPNEAHRAAPGYEGVALHARDIAAQRGRIEDAAVVFLSPTPSLRLYAPESGASRLPPRKPARWPAVRLVDMRGTGATLSSTLLDACRDALGSGGRVGAVVNRLGYAAFVSCARCGHVASCPNCDRPLALHGSPGGPSGRNVLVCGTCGFRREAARQCPDCGSERLGEAGLAVDGARASLAQALGIEVGLLTAEKREAQGAPVVVCTPRYLAGGGGWDLVAVPDADSLLFGSGSTDRGFRLLYGAAEASRGRLLVQTRSPEHSVLRAALADDYEGFAAAALPRRRLMSYPPYGHLAKITLTGSEDEVRLAVKSGVRPAPGTGVEMTGPAAVPAGPAGETMWRLLLCGRRREAVAQAASRVARMAATRRGRLRARIEVDPEEV